MKKRDPKTEHVPLPEHTIVRRRDLYRYVALGRTVLADEIKAGRFPKSFALTAGGRAKAWRLSDVLAWQAVRVAASQDQ